MNICIYTVSMSMTALVLTANIWGMVSYFDAEQYVSKIERAIIIQE